MLGYLLAALSVLAGVTKAYASKKSSIYISNVSENTFSNVLRMAFCSVIGLAMLLIQGASLSIDGGTFAISLLSGVSNAVFIITWLAATQRGAYMLLNIFYLLGVLVPLLLCRVLYDEPIRLIQWAGLAVLLLAVWIICSYNKTLGGKLTGANLTILIVCALTGGLADFSQKMFLYHDPNGVNSVFQFYTFLISTVVLVCIYVFTKWKGKAGEGKVSFAGERVLFPKIISYVSVMAVCMFACNWLKTAAGEHLTSAQLYPFLQGTNLILLSIMSAVCFGEKITVRSLVGIGLAFVSLLMMNLL